MTSFSHSRGPSLGELAEDHPVKASRQQTEGRSRVVGLGKSPSEVLGRTSASCSWALMIDAPLDDATVGHVRAWSECGLRAIHVPMCFFEVTKLVVGRDIRVVTHISELSAMKIEKRVTLQTATQVLLSLDSQTEGTCERPDAQASEVPLSQPEPSQVVEGQPFRARRSHPPPGLDIRIN